MRIGLFFFRTLLLCAFFWLFSASSASAQCGANAVAFGDVSLVPNNPFHAELVTTGSPRPLGSLSPLYRHPELVARDREGRVRIERISGEYLRQTGPDAGTKAEMHLIMICDPVAQTLTQIDTATSSARIYHAHAASSGGLHASLGSVPPKPYCSWFFTRPHPDNLAVERPGISKQGRAGSARPTEFPDSAQPRRSGSSDRSPRDHRTMVLRAARGDGQHRKPRPRDRPKFGAHHDQHRARRTRPGAVQDSARLHGR